MAGSASGQGVVEVEPVVHIVEAVEDEYEQEGVHYPSTDEYLDADLLQTTVPDPIRLRGVGGTTLFGLSSRFADEYPSYLSGKVAPEEFYATIQRVNSIVQKQVPLGFKCFLLGCFCCCCTAGLSLGPAMILNKRTKYLVEKVLEQENLRLYNRLGLNWRLISERIENVHLREYVVVIEFMPKLPLYRPD